MRKCDHYSSRENKLVFYLQESPRAIRYTVTATSPSESERHPVLLISSANRRGRGTNEKYIQVSSGT